MALARRITPEEAASLAKLQANLRGSLPSHVAAVRKALARFAEARPAGAASAGGAASPGKLGGHRIRKRLVKELEALEQRVIDAHERPAPRPMHLLPHRGEALSLLPRAAGAGDARRGGGDRHDPDRPADRARRPARHGCPHRPDRPPRRAAAPLPRTPPPAAARRARATQATPSSRSLQSWEEEAVALRAQVLLSASPVKTRVERPAADR